MPPQQSCPARRCAQAPIVIKFSHVVATDTPKGKARRPLQGTGRKATNGRVKVEVYPNSQLYKDKEEIEALQLGAVQMLAPSLAKFGPLGVQGIRSVRPAVHLPVQGRAVPVTEGPVGKDLLKKLEPKGIIGLAYWDNGFKVMSRQQADAACRPTSRA